MVQLHVVRDVRRADVALRRTTVSDFDIEWEPSAYAKNKAGKYDYSLVEKSTETLAKLPRFKPLDSEQLKAMGAL